MLDQNMGSMLDLNMTQSAPIWPYVLPAGPGAESRNVDRDRARAPPEGGRPPHLRRRGAVGSSCLAGPVYSTVTVTDLAEWVEGGSDCFTGLALRGVALATAAMPLRNAVPLALISPTAALAAAVPMVLMITATFLLALLRRSEDRPSPQESGAAVAMKFGLIFLALQVVGANRLPCSQRDRGEAPGRCHCAGAGDEPRPAPCRPTWGPSGRC